MQTTTKRSNFVAAHPDPAPAPVAVVDAQPIQITDTGRAWEVPSNPSKDSVSAKDRAEALAIRARPLWYMVGATSTAATAGWAIVAWAAGIGAPFLLDKLLVFLATYAALSFVTYLRLNRLDHDHSRAGVERLKIKAAADVRRAELDAELKLRLAALDAQIRLIESRAAQNRPDRAIGVDHE